MHRIAIVGLGLMGGSLGAALLKHRDDVEVVGVARNEGTLKKATEKKAIHWGTTDISIAVKGASIIFVATPVRTIPSIIRKVANHIRGEAVITDMGSTKEFVQKELQTNPLPPHIQYVGGHPIAGSEKSSIEHIDGNLFKGRPYVLIPHETNERTLFLRDLIKSIGARIIIMHAAQHDTFLALSSHLPHLIASALVLELRTSTDTPPFVPQSFQDLTRIAASSPSIWMDIFLTNKDNIHHSIEGMCQLLKKLDNAISSSPKQLEELLSTAKQFKDWLNTLS